MEDRQLTESAPLPLARAFRRYWNSAEGRERHDAAYFLFEVYVKYAASIAIARYLAGDARDHRVNAVLKGLVRPSLGEWLRFLRECSRFLAEGSGDSDPVARAMVDLLGRKESRWTHVLRLHNRLRGFCSGAEGEKTRVGLGDLLADVVTYRNRVLGHGAPLEAGHYREFAQLFGEAFPEVYRESPFLSSLRLVSFASLHVEDGSRIECEVIEHMGLQPARRSQPLVLDLKESRPPRKGGLYLLDAEGGRVLVEPLLISHRDDIYFLNEADGAPEYLSYSTGDRHRPSGAGSAQGELFERILGYKPDSGALSRIGVDLSPPPAAPAAPEAGERRLGDYRIVREVGRGAMGVVFEAFQESLGRRVALKVLPGNFALDPKRVERFRREARATARILHPAIVPVYEVGESGGTHFYSMEFIDGPSLADSMEAERLRAKEKPGTGSSGAEGEALRRAVEQMALVAEGLDVAHRQGLVHRDVKPSNILVDGGGRYVLVDFGLVRDEESVALTRSGEMVGTLGYMSPEQVSRRPVDARSDVYGLGATLYEVLTLHAPFAGEGESEHAVHNAILFKEPPSPRKIRPRVPADLETIVLKALEKDPDRRYPSAGELAADLRRCLRGDPIRARAPSTWTRISRSALRHRVRLALVGTTLIAIAAVTLMLWTHAAGKAQRVSRETLLPEIERLIGEEDFLAAYDKAREAERSIADDPVLARLWPRMTLSCTITSKPPGAEVSFKRYEDLAGAWIPLGTTPLEDIRIPRGIFRWRVVRPGYETLECGPRRSEDHLQAEAFRVAKTIDFELFEEKDHPPGMVWIPAGNLQIWLAYTSALRKGVKAPGYWMDRFEVTNEEFQEFVDAGGYRNPKFWKEAFAKDGQVLSWETALEAFRDRTGKPGPAGWEGGKHPPGKEKHPVAGVSWYEAAAFAEFKGKSLPTIFHWSHAACTNEASIITRLSNFGEDGTAPVGSHAGIGFTGLFDMAGNVKEWCWNAADPSGNRRYILGGAWGEPTYQFGFADARSPWDRAQTNGFRCVWHPGGVSALPSDLFPPIAQGFWRDFRKLEPVTDVEFDSFRQNLYTYDRGDLKSAVESVDDSPEAWRQEKVSYAAGYGGERMSAYVFVPKGVLPPFQAVIHFPGIYARSDRRTRFEGESAPYTEFVIQSGRVLIYPVYKGTYDRAIDWSEEGPAAERDWQIDWSKEVFRTIDYLESRPDIDRRKIAYYGLSWGARIGPIFLALDDRLKAGVLYLGGLDDGDHLPPADPFHFCPRVKVPVLLVSGEFDLVFPLEDSVKPFFERLGTPPADKKHVILPGGHGLMGLFGKEIRAEILDWLDRSLGPVSK